MNIRSSRSPSSMIQVWSTTLCRPWPPWPSCRLRNKYRIGLVQTVGQAQALIDRDRPSQNPSKIPRFGPSLLCNPPADVVLELDVLQAAAEHDAVAVVEGGEEDDLAAPAAPAPPPNPPLL
jgi:hypothetical protein